MFSFWKKKKKEFIFSKLRRGKTRLQTKAALKNSLLKFSQHHWLFVMKAIGFPAVTEETIPSKLSAVHLE